ncbi:hypothetical protein [Pseudonocardia spinosispora]|uniref:hypothetical protein n=1 Tax=Pseudonocardia spinosispora TaxID=103441 RepID=UPI00048F46D2|nr:hypothetical protein [Pseudonocardia spinosispora]
MDQLASVDADRGGGSLQLKVGAGIFSDRLQGPLAASLAAEFSQLSGVVVGDVVEVDQAVQFGGGDRDAAGFEFGQLRGVSVQRVEDLFGLAAARGAVAAQQHAELQSLDATRRRLWSPHVHI